MTPNILVIDDDEAIPLILKKVLTKFGFSVELAADGLEGVKKFDEGNFALVITDIIMPGLNGMGVVRHIRRSKKRSTPIVGISGTPWLLARGDFDAVFEKPSSIMAIVDTVQDLTCVHP